MSEPLRCRPLPGHAEHPELALDAEMNCAPLAEPVPVHYVLLTGKHFEERLQPGAFVALSSRQAVLESASPVPAYANLMLQLDATPGEAAVPELYAKAIRALDAAASRSLIHFTSAPAHRAQPPRAARGHSR